jgi:DNA-binding MarR family transcriptional regulator
MISLAEKRLIQKVISRSLDDADRVQDLRLSRVERRIIQFSLNQDAPLTTVFVAGRLGYTQQYASEALKRLSEVHYFERQLVATGNVGPRYYKYTLVAHLRKAFNKD